MWPLERDCDAFYGNPRNPRNPAVINPQWEAENVVRIKAPYPLTYDGKPVSLVTSHKKCADALRAALGAAWEKVGRDLAKAQQLHMTIYGGGLMYRLKRNGTTLSMHSWACAWDFDPANNRLGQTKPFFTADHPLVQAFIEQGAEWGGSWSYKDAMHFQFARTK